MEILVIEINLKFFFMLSLMKIKGKNEEKKDRKMFQNE